MKIGFKKLLFSTVFLCGLCLSSTTLFAAESRDVNNFKEFKDALMNQAVTEINVKSSISFTENIWGIPNRDLTINGNANNGVVISSNQWSIYGKQNTAGKNTLSILDAKIVGRGTPTKDAYTDGRFFTGGQENGPNAYGWDVYAKNINYVGARFVHLSNGTLTFDGNNEIYTNSENAWVNHVIFKANSTYKSSNSGTGDYGAFYFNKGKGIADGTATIEAGAKTYFNIGTPVQPVFTGDIYKTTIGENALFDVKTLGHAVWYVAGHPTYYKVGNPEFNVESGAEVNIKQVSSDNILNSQNRTNPNKNFYVPIYFAKSTTSTSEVPGTINVKPGAKFYVSGQTLNNSKSGVILMGTGSAINLDRPADFDIRNNAINSNAISTNNSLQTIVLNINSDIKSWLKTSNGSYDDNRPYNAFSSVVGTVFMKYNNTVTNSTNNDEFNKNHAMQNYGRIALKGGYVVEQFTVTFDTQGGSDVTPNPVVVNAGEKINPPSQTTKPGFTFDGWYKDASGSAAWDFNNDTVNADTTLFAKWTIIPVEQFTVTFDTQGGSDVTPNPVVVNAGEKINPPSQTTKPNFTFVGWYKDASGSVAWDFNNDTVNANTTLFAKWTIIPVEQFTVTFDTQGGSDVTPNPVVVNAGEKINPPSQTTKPNFTFVGWYKDASGSIAWDFNNDTVNADTTLFAKWTIIPVEQFTVTFDTQGGSDVTPNPVIVNAGEKINPPSQTTKPNFTFVGWYKDASGSVAWDFNNDTVNADTTIYAVWEENQKEKYVVTFDSQGGSDITPNNILVLYGEKVQKPSDPSRSGYIFDGWYKDSSAQNPWDFNNDVIVQNTTLYANWIEEAHSAYHTVTFDSQGGSYVAPYTDVSHGSKIYTPRTPEKDGYCFLGWYTDTNFEVRWRFAHDVVNSDITLYAKWGLL